MRVEENYARIFDEVSHAVRNRAWDISENWLEETKLSPSAWRLLKDVDTRLDRMPTLIGGVARIIEEPEFMIDLEAGGSLRAAAEDFGRLQQESGLTLSALLEDFGLLRQKLWFFCETVVAPEDPNLFELERRLNTAVDKIAAVAAGAYHDRSTQELVNLAQTDKLTSFLHADAFARALDREFSRAKRYHHPLSLIIADVDDFKRINREDGRIEGNRILREIAAVVGSGVRATDLAARLVADEFAVALPETPANAARQTAERLRRGVRRITRGDLPITVSVGVAEFPSSAESKTGLLERAGEALAKARRDNGDVVRMAD